MRNLFLGAVLGVALIAGQHEAMHQTPIVAPSPAPEWRPRGWIDVICTIVGHLPDWCPRPIKEVEPVPPPVSGSTPACDPTTQSCQP